jgi:hypothetical protein
MGRDAGFDSSGGLGIQRVALEGAAQPAQDLGACVGHRDDRVI